MATKVKNYIYDRFNERGMKSFERRVTKLLKDNCIEGEFICHSAYMKKGNGYGSYYKCIGIEINNNREEIEIVEHTNDSQMWDNWYEPGTKDKRDLFFAVLENKIEELKDILNEI